MDEHSNLLRKLANYGCKKFYDICGLYYKSFMIIIYDHNDSTIVIYDHNDSG